MLNEYLIEILEKNRYYYQEQLKNLGDNQLIILLISSLYVDMTSLFTLKSCLSLTNQQMINSCRNLIFKLDRLVSSGRLNLEQIQYNLEENYSECFNFSYFKRFICCLNFPSGLEVMDEDYGRGKVAKWTFQDLFICRKDPNLYIHTDFEMNGKIYKKSITDLVPVGVVSNVKTDENKDISSKSHEGKRKINRVKKEIRRINKRIMKTKRIQEKIHAKRERNIRKDMIDTSPSSQPLQLSIVLAETVVDHTIGSEENISNLIIDIKSEKINTLCSQGEAQPAEIQEKLIQTLTESTSIISGISENDFIDLPPFVEPQILEIKPSQIPINITIEKGVEEVKIDVKPEPSTLPIPVVVDTKSNEGSSCIIC